MKLKVYDIDLDYPYNEYNGSYYDRYEVDEYIGAMAAQHRDEVTEMGRRLRHANYVRCMKVAKWCDQEEFYAEDCKNERRVDWAIKWYKRWLALADKYKGLKPVKETL